MLRAINGSLERINVLQQIVPRRVVMVQGYSRWTPAKRKKKRCHLLMKKRWTPADGSILTPEWAWWHVHLRTQKVCRARCWGTSLVKVMLLDGWSVWSLCIYLKWNVCQNKLEVIYYWLLSQHHLKFPSLLNLFSYFVPIFLSCKLILHLILHTC